MGEDFWQDEVDPEELRRRAEHLRVDGWCGVADQLEERARFIEHQEDAWTRKDRR